MGHARLKGLRVKALRSFAEPSEILFPESGLVLLRGKNLDSGGSSGSGKSSLLLAIAYLFGFCRYPGTALQSWLTEDPLEVTGTLQVDEGELVVSRGQRLSLTLNGKKVSGSAAQLEGRLTKLVGLAPDLLAALTYRGQKQPGLFLSKTDAEKKEFLTVLLDLGRFELEVEGSQAKAKVLESKVQTEDYIATDTANRLQKYRDNYKPGAVIPEEQLRGQLDSAQQALDRIRKQASDLRVSVREAEDAVEIEAARRRRIQEPALLVLEERALHLVHLEEEGPEHSPDLSRLVQLEQDLAQAKSFLKSELDADQERYRAHRQHADSIHAQMVLVEKRLATRPALSMKMSQLRSEIAKLESNVCPTCDREWEEAKTKKQELAGELAKAVLEYEELDGLKDQISRLQKEREDLGEFTSAPAVQELRDIVTALSAQVLEEKANIEGAKKLFVAEHQRLVAQAHNELAQARASLATSIEIYRAEAMERLQDPMDELEALEREQRMAEAHVAGIQASLSRALIDNAREAEREKQYRATISEMEESLEVTRGNLAGYRSALNAELDFQKLIGREGFLGAIFDEVLWEISEETNRLLAQFPNTAHVTLHFRSESITQKGTTKKAITPVVSIGGFEAPLSSGLSGGMETAVELAVDLAVAQVVSRRTGAVPGWLILDESFTGLGPVEAEASMEILRAFAEDKLVLVVDHASEFKSLFSQFVDVEYQAGYSRVKEAQ